MAKMGPSHVPKKQGVMMPILSLTLLIVLEISTIFSFWQASWRLLKKFPDDKRERESITTYLFSNLNEEQNVPRSDHTQLERSADLAPSLMCYLLCDDEEKKLLHPNKTRERAFMCSCQ